MGESSDVNRDLVVKPEGKKPLGRSRSRWEDSINLGLNGSGKRGYGLDRAGSG